MTLAALALLTVGWMYSTGTPAAYAAAGINHQINFQGKLVNPSGTNVTDGSYSIVFSLYSVASGGSAIWTETQNPTVTNGIFQVNLGSVTSLPGSIDFNTDNIYLGIKVGADAEMTPRVQFTSVPQAFNSEKLGGLDSSGFIQNQTTSPQTADFNISGNGTLGGTLTVSSSSNLIGALTLGTASSATGQLKLGNSSSAYMASIQSAAYAQNSVITLPASVATDTICLQTLANCGGSGSGVTTVGTYSVTNIAVTGATITGSSVIFQDASASAPGMVGTGTQTFGGTKTFSNGIVIASGQSVTVTGSGTRPGSPTAGQIYFDTTTNQLIQYNGTKWVSDRATSSKVVAASNSPQAVKDAADYVASGISDDATINTALTAAAGGSVYLAEGTYYETNSINIPNETTLFGAGSGTIITEANGQNGSFAFIQNSDSSSGNAAGIAIHDLIIDGNKANQTTDMTGGIYMVNMSPGTGSTAHNDVTITHVTVRNLFYSANAAMYLAGVSNSLISESVVQANAGYGIYLYYGSLNNKITSNSVMSNGNEGLLIAGNNNMVSGNKIHDNGSTGIDVYASYENTVSNNTVEGNTGVGVNIDSSAFHTIVTSNVIDSTSGDGLRIYNTSFDNSVTNNKIYANSGIGIHANAPNNLISGNKIYNNGGPTLNNSIVLILGADSNTVINNDITDESCTSTCYWLTLTNAENNYISGNQHSHTGSTSNLDAIYNGSSFNYLANQIDYTGSLINQTLGGLSVGYGLTDATLNVRGGILSYKLNAPNLSSSITNVGTPGSTTYRYQVTAYDGIGETTGSTIRQTTTGNATLDTNNYNTITWTPSGGAIYYKVYKCATASCTPAYIATVVGRASYNDQSNSFGSGSAPVTNTTGSASIANAIQGGSSLTLGTSSSVDGSVVLKNSAGATSFSLLGTGVTTSYSLTVAPTGATGTQCLSSTSGSTTAATVLQWGTCGTVYTTTTLDAVANAGQGIGISGSTIFLQSATSTKPGAVNAGSQTFGGDKTFSSNSATALSVTNGTTAALNVDASVGTLTLRGTTTASDAAVIGAELFTGGAVFNAATGWTGITGTNQGATAVHTAGGGTTSIATSFTPVSGATYRVSFSVTGNSTATEYVTANLGGDISSRIGQTGSNTHTVVLTTSSTAALTFIPTSNFNGSISSVSVKLITTSTSVLTVKSSSGTPALEVRTSAANVNTFIGYRSGQADTTGTNNTALGYYALQANTIGGINTAVGSSALQYNTTGTQNTAIGVAALQKNTSGTQNSAVGVSALLSNTVGNNNTALGYNALTANVTGSDNTAIGWNALLGNTTGLSNSAFGSGALVSNTTGNYNSAFGSTSLSFNSTGAQNSAYGTLAMQNNTTGSNNVAAGYVALASNTTGNYNTVSGVSALQRNTVGSNNTASGWSSFYNLKTLTNSITATATNGGNAQFTTGSTTGLTAGATITIAGTTSYNGTKTILSVDSSTTFTISTAFSTADTTGTWTTANTDNNTAFGYQAGFGTSNGYTAVGSSLFGSNAGLNLQTGADNNTLIGYNAGSGITIGTANVLLGYNAGTNLTTGSNNIIIGQGATASSATISNYLNIGGVIQGDLSTGKVIIKPVSDSLSSFEIQNSTGTALLVADTSSLSLKVGGGDVSAASTVTLHVLDNKSSASGSGDPSGVNGAMYYNQASNRFRCYENSAWADCLGYRHLLTVASNVASTASITCQSITGLSFAVTSNVTYRFHATILHTASATTIGAGFGVSAPAAPTQFAMNASVASAAAASTAENIAALSTCTASSSSAATSGNIDTVDGVITPSASGTFQLQFEPETATASGTVIMPGSTLEWW